MLLVRLLSRSDALCRHCMLQVNKLCYRGLSSGTLPGQCLSPLRLNSVCRPLHVGTSACSWVQTTHNERLQATVQQRSNFSSAGTPEAKVPANNKTTEQDIARFLREMGVICEKVKELGLPPDTSWQDHVSVEVVRELHNVLSSLTPLALLHLMYAFSSLPEIDSFTKDVIVSQFLKSMRHLSVTQLLRIVQLRDDKDLCLEPSVCDNAMSLLQQRWVEIKSGRDVVTLMYIVSDESTQFLDRLEDRALDICDSMSVKELYRAIYCLARRRRRNTPLLRALMYYLDRQELDLSPLHLSNLAFAMAVLNVHDAGVLDKLVKAVYKVVTEDKAHLKNAVVRHVLSSVVQSLGILRWFDKHFIDVTVEQFACLSVDSSDWVRLLHTLAWLSYLPPQLGKNGLAQIMKRMLSLHHDSPMLWLDAVWSCCVLDSLTAELAASVLSSQFIDKLEGSCGESGPVSYAAKLLAVNAVARNMLPGYSGPLLSDELMRFIHTLTAVPASAGSDMFKSVVDALSEIAPVERYLQTSVTVPSGHVIDAVMLVNDRGEPQPFDNDPSAPSAGISSDHCRIHRVAFQTLEFTDMISDGQSMRPSGPSLLASQCFKMAGYRVVPVAFNEFDVTLPVVKRVRYLVRKFRAVVAEDHDDSVTTRQQAVPEPDVDTSSEPVEDHVTSDIPAEFQSSVFSSDVQNIRKESYELERSELDLSASPLNTKETASEQTSGFVQELLNSRGFSASASSVGDTCELKDVKSRSSVPVSSTPASSRDDMKQKRKTKRTKASSEALVKSTNFTDVDTRSQTNTIDFVRELLKNDSLFLSDEQRTPGETLSDVKTSRRRRKTKMTASDEVAQTS